MRTRRRILHPSDFSPASRAAFRRAIDLAKASRAELILVHVLSPLPLMPDVYLAATTYDRLRASIRALGRKRLDRLLAQARAAGARARGFLLDGTPYTQIVRAARAKRASMIVMGTHGRSGLARFALGSVAERVIATAACPVLTVRGR